MTRRGSSFSRTRRRTLSKKDKQGLMIMAGVGLTFLIIAAMAVIMNRQLDQIDKTTFCPKHFKGAHTIVLVDQSDAYSSNQQAALMGLMRDLKDKLVEREKLSLFVLDFSNYSAPEPLFSKCNPGRGEQANELYQNPELIRQRFDEFFGQPLERDIQALSTVKTAPRSPILEILRTLSLRDDFGRELEARRLIIVSDLLQNVPGYSHYRDRPSFEKFIQTPYAQSVLPALKGVHINVLYLQRPQLTEEQVNRHVTFWRELFAHVGAFLGFLERAR